MRILSSYSLMFPLAGPPSPSMELGGRMGKRRKHLFLDWCSHCSLIGTWRGISRGVACGPQCTHLWCQTQCWPDHFQPLSASTRSLSRGQLSSRVSVVSPWHWENHPFSPCHMVGVQDALSIYSVISLQFLSHTSKFRGPISKSIPEADTQLRKAARLAFFHRADVSWPTQLSLNFFCFLYK